MDFHFPANADWCKFYIKNSSGCRRHLHFLLYVYLFPIESITFCAEKLSIGEPNALMCPMTTPIVIECKFHVLLKAFVPQKLLSHLGCLLYSHHDELGLWLIMNVQAVGHSAVITRHVRPLIKFLWYEKDFSVMQMIKIRSLLVSMYTRVVNYIKELLIFPSSLFSYWKRNK